MVLVVQIGFSQRYCPHVTVLTQCVVYRVARNAFYTMCLICTSCFIFLKLNAAAGNGFFTKLEMLEFPFPSSSVVHGLCIYCCAEIHDRTTLCMYVCMYMCMYVRTYACIYVCMHVWMYVCVYVCVSVYVCVCLYVCVYVPTYVRMYVCVCVCVCCFNVVLRFSVLYYDCRIGREAWGNMQGGGHLGGLGINIG
jgi:hypothetical protein